jgi:hypothetical protein
MADETWVPVVGGVLGLACLWMALRAGRKRRFLDDTPTSKARGVFIGDVELKGAVECDRPLTSHLAEVRCVWYRWSVAEHWRRVVRETYTDEKGRVRTRTRVESGTTVVASGEDSTPFFLRDDTGAVLVRPQGAEIEGAVVLSTTVGPGHRLYYGKGPRGAVMDSTFQRDFLETAIATARPVYLVGRARERKDAVAPEIAADKRAEMYLISVRSEEDISRSHAFGHWLWFALGLACAGGTFAWYEQTLGFDPDRQLRGYALLATACLFAWLLGWAWMVHDSLVGLRQRVRQGLGNLEVQLKRRHDLVPRLAAIVSGLSQHEQSVQESLAALRAQASIPPGAERGGAARLEALAPRLVALRESHPRLVAQEGFLELQRQLSDTETRIALARTYYNDIASAYNARLLVVPDRYAAALARLRPEPLFAAEGFERAAVAVEFQQDPPGSDREA